MKYQNRLMNCWDSSWDSSGTGLGRTSLSGSNWARSTFPSVAGEKVSKNLWCIDNYCYA